MSGGRRTAEQAFGAQVFVNVRPVNSISSAADFPMRSLLLRRLKEPGIPRQGNYDGSAIGKVHRQRVLGDMHVAHAFSGIRVETVHTISPSTDYDCRPLSDGHAGAPPGQTQGSSRGRPDPARILLRRRRDPHGHGAAQSVRGCESKFGKAPPSVWLARQPSVSWSKGECTPLNAVMLQKTITLL